MLSTVNLIYCEVAFNYCKSEVGKLDKQQLFLSEILETERYKIDCTE